MIKYHIIALFGGFLLDLLVGDPHWLPHPIRLIGSLIAKCSKWNRAELKKGDTIYFYYQGICEVPGRIRE